MAEMKISNTLVNDTSTGVIAYAEQLKDRLLQNYIANSPDFNATDRGRIPTDIKDAEGVFQGKLNEFFLKHWVDFQRFLLDEGVDPDTIDSWYEVKRFLDGLDDDTSMWLKNKLQEIDNCIYDLYNIDGGAFDISAANQSEGVYAQYATLAEALAAVPASNKKSGMTVRFLSSYTGQYEQYRYMLKYESTTAGNESFLDPSNWRGVDFYPSADSENLVRSGGLYEWSSEAGEIVDVSSDDWEPTTAEQRFEQVQMEIRDLNAIINTEQLRIGAVQIDALPVEGSGHAISSGGVYTVLQAQETEIETLNTKTTTEIQRAQSAEQILDDKITTETTRAKDAENILQRNIDAKYTKPSTGIAKSDLDSDIQTSLDKADTALQKHQDISGKADKSTTYTKTEVDNLLSPYAEIGELVETI